MDLNLKAIRTFIIENNISNSKEFYEADLPFIDFKVKVSKKEQEFHITSYVTGLSQTIGKVFNDRVFFHGDFDRVTKREIEGSLKTSEEYGISIIMNKKLEREIINTKQEQKKVRKI